MAAGEDTLVDLRRRCGRGLRETAKLVGLTEQQYRAVEAGDRGLDGFRVRPLAEALNVRPDVIEGIVQILPASTFGQKIGAMRRRIGLSQAELGELMGVGPNQVSRWENDRSAPPLARVEDLARFLRCSVNDLVESGDTSSLDHMEMAMIDKFAEVPEDEKARAFALVMGILSGFAMVPKRPSNDDGKS